jgi:hypothetical protein
LAEGWLKVLELSAGACTACAPDLLNSPQRHLLGVGAN